ncbi:MAG: protein-L-isoaspartate O-methyltransferase [Chromatiales bacterium]|nr:protein-L-isoaspartate O-methyltransferase [Chromatiales bacterium]
MTAQIEEARTRMIDQQVRAWSVLDPCVLDVLRSVPRERFVPPAYAAVAFADTEIPLGQGEFMMTPQVEGRLLQSLELQPTDQVLEIGTGSGFLTACLARLAGSVESLELRADLAARARENLAAAGIGNARVIEADAFSFRPDSGYDAIAITGSMPKLQGEFRQWLNPGGRLFVVLGQPPVMEAMLVRRADGDMFRSQSLFETMVVPLRNAPASTEFSF